MDFHDHLSRETTALINHLIASHRDQSTRALAAYRGALDAALQALEATAAVPSGVPQEQLDTLLDRLSRAAAAQNAARIEEALLGAREEHDARFSVLNSEREQLASENAALAVTVAELRADAETVFAERLAAEDAHRAEHFRLTEAVAAANTEMNDAQAARAAADSARVASETARTAADAAREEAAAARYQIEASHAESETARTRAETALQQEAAEKATLAEQVAALRAALDAQAAEQQQTAQTVTDLRTQLQDAHAAVQSRAAEAADAVQKLDAIEQTSAGHATARNELQGRLEAAADQERQLRQRDADLQQEIDRLRSAAEVAAQAAAEAAAAWATGATSFDAQQARELEDLRADLATRAAQPLNRLLAVFQSLADRTTLPDVLTTVVNGLSREFSRVAFFSIRANRLEGVHQVGFDLKSDISKVVIPLTMDSLLRQAVTSGRMERLTSSDFAEATPAPFGGSPACAVALPIVVHGETLAVIYGDDSGHAELDPESANLRMTFAELLLRHSQPMLAALSTDAKGLAELRDYATLLVSELEYAYTADAGAGKKGSELQARLLENLQCARRIFAQRVASERAPAGHLLEERLATFVTERAGTAFGRDLAAAAARDSEAVRVG